VKTLTLDRLRREGQQFMEEVSREYYLAHAGLKATADLQTIYERHAAILGEDALSLVREAFRAAPANSDERRSARVMLEWLTDSVAGRALAALDEREIAWESSAVVRLDDDRVIPYQRAAIDIGNTANRAERQLIERGRVRVVEAELTPLRRERFQREKELIEAMEIAPSFNETFEVLSGVDLTALIAECDQFLRDTQSMWDEVYAETVRTKLRLDPGEATRADALHLLRAQEFDAHFPSASMESSIRRQTSEMGIDPDASGRIIYDTGEREGKRARAFCAPVRVPEEVYLVLRPHGGQADYRTLLHELGHALHFAYMRTDYPFEWRWLGDNSVTEAYAMLLDHLMHDAGWLVRYTELGRRHAPTFLRTVGFEELHFLRRYCAKLIYETALYGGEVGWNALPDLYVERLTSATTFRYDRADAFVDVDPRFYAARYLRAWQLQALLTEALVERFDEDWWRNPRAGPWLVGTLFGEGQRELAGEIAERSTGRSLSFAPLVRAIEGLLVTS
jgi:Peptidase family M3